MLTNFLSEINAKGISKASHFDVEFTLPSGVGRGTSITNRDVNQPIYPEDKWSL